jgi:DNA-binding response OmpR family regulator
VTIHLLLVDDDRTLTGLIATLLEFDGFTVKTLASGNAVLPELAENRPDAVMMDVHLADASGLDVVRAIRQVEGLDDLPVILASGMDVEDQAKAAGASAFLIKPFAPDQLAAYIQTVIATAHPSTNHTP